MTNSSCPSDQPNVIERLACAPSPSSSFHDDPPAQLVEELLILKGSSKQPLALLA
jgi:hypothetical protein